MLYDTQKFFLVAQGSAEIKAATHDNMTNSCHPEERTCVCGNINERAENI